MEQKRDFGPLWDVMNSILVFYKLVMHFFDYFKTLENFFILKDLNTDKKNALNFFFFKLINA